MEIYKGIGLGGLYVDEAKVFQEESSSSSQRVSTFVGVLQRWASGDRVCKPQFAGDEVVERLQRENGRLPDARDSRGWQVPAGALGLVYAALSLATVATLQAESESMAVRNAARVQLFRAVLIWVDGQAHLAEDAAVSAVLSSLRCSLRRNELHGLLRGGENDVLQSAFVQLCEEAVRKMAASRASAPKPATRTGEAPPNLSAAVDACAYALERLSLEWESRVAYGVALTRLAERCLRAGQFWEARQAYSDARTALLAVATPARHAIDYHLRTAPAGLAVALLALGRFDEAAGTLVEALQFYPVLPRTLRGGLRHLFAPTVSVDDAIAEFRQQKLSTQNSSDEWALLELYIDALEGAKSLDDRWKALQKNAQCTRVQWAALCFQTTPGSFDGPEEAALVGLSASPPKSSETDRGVSLMHPLSMDEDLESGAGFLPKDRTDALATTDAQDLSERQLCELARDMMRPQVGVPLGDRRWRLRYYRNCFVGSEAVGWLVEHVDMKNGRAGAVKVGQRLMELKLMSHVASDHPFTDEFLFYVWSDPRLVAPRLQMGYLEVRRGDGAPALRWLQVHENGWLSLWEQHSSASPYLYWSLKQSRLRLERVRKQSTTSASSSSAAGPLAGTASALLSWVGGLSWSPPPKECGATGGGAACAAPQSALLDCSSDEMPVIVLTLASETLTISPADADSGKPNALDPWVKFISRYAIVQARRK